MKQKESVLSKDFSKRLRQLRQDKGWSQGQLAQKIGVENNRISRYERAALWPTLELMVRIAETFDVSVDYLIRDAKEMSIYKISNPDLMKRVEEVEKLPKDYQKTLITVLDAFVKKYKFETLAKSK